MQLAPLGESNLWLRKKKKPDENKFKERRRQGPKYDLMRREFDKKTETSETLRAAQVRVSEVDSRIENLRRIAQIGKLRKP